MALFTESRDYIKEYNFILYNPGEAGNFLSRLFSLSDGTQFLWTQGTCACVPKDHSLQEKLKWYWYSPDKIKQWLRDAHHIPHGWDMIMIRLRDWEFNTSVITCGHYDTFHFMNDDDMPHIFNPARKEIIERFFAVRVNRENIKRLITTSVKVPRDLDAVTKEVTHRISVVTTIEDIYLDDILLGGQFFLKEYHRVCGLMNIVPIPDDVALMFLDNWKSFRYPFLSPKT